MPAVQALAKVLVTGASGFLASHVVKTLLEDGYTVVGTVRSTSKGDYLVKLFDSDKFSYAVVPDMGTDDAFDKVLEEGGFDAVEHTASPFYLVVDDPQDVIRPAIAGTTNILKAVMKHGHNVKRVVITSSVQAIIEPKSSAYNFTESDWNDDSVNEVNTKGFSASGLDKYSASKSLAERAAWKFMKDHSDSVHFDLATINPPYIFGPLIHEIPSLKALNESHAVFLEGIKSGGGKTADETGAFAGNMSDVRDVARAQVSVLETEEAGGERFITSSGPFSWQNVYDALNAAGIPNAPNGHPGSSKPETFHTHDASKSSRVLGVNYRSRQEIAVDTYKTLKQRFPDAL